ncbi:MAG: tetratricopeptide repeat protein [Candidatus Marinimicrobia bacterium]|nr:tetratricopeptide repeat protein [Candidatus Neomarinimicrobiota bacterium]MBL7023590.1 tetratricopeptide repeat protein [Candidatus Neomarinimicrobiota bacterium]MBL7109520.1 tetratricopeptide repeat protein [Candidatus Neomarinimicrobiota bacterium]
MNKPTTSMLNILLFMFISLSFCEDNHLWDLGLTIKKPNEIQGDSLVIIKKTELSLSGNHRKSRIYTKTKNDFNIQKDKDINQNSCDIETIAIQSMHNREYNKSLKLFLKIDLENLPEQRKNNIYYWISNIYYKLGNSHQALLSLDKISKASPLLDATLLLKGMIYSSQNENTKAIDCYKSILKNYPKSEFCSSAKFELRRLTKRNQ